MVNQGKSTIQLPVKTSVYDANDMMVMVYGYDTANSSNAVAQTAIITPQLAGIPQFPGPIYTIGLTFSAGQISTCKDTPITILAAQGPNSFIMPISILLIASPGNAWTCPGAGFWLNLSGGNAVDDNVFSYAAASANGGIGFSSAAYVFSNNIGLMVNQPLVLSSNVSNPTGGNTSMTGWMQYTVLENLP